MMHPISPGHIVIPVMCAYSFTMHHLALCLVFILHASCMEPDRYQGGYHSPEPIVAVAFPTTAVVRTQAQHEEAIRGIHEQLLGVPIQDELTALRFRVEIAETDNASLRTRIKTTKAIKKITRNRERQARVKIE
nr:hypothetical protein [Tanacetum cinerariifolium]